MGKDFSRSRTSEGTDGKGREDYIVALYLVDSLEDLSNLGLRLKEDLSNWWIRLKISAHASRDIGLSSTCAEWDTKKIGIKNRICVLIGYPKE
ncbi:hypothetical protein MTR67_044687 [Solanum verrucosum]|uniref:Uncharacterized protein n=1 Tax=Solanum verrucosum TaxID=315347 RepID=A0AAF0ZT47_SOLVR|nr:hypothetical protein MTR67_044687 [Solanum verrucosum]